jgi:hypothetical protein
MRGDFRWEFVDEVIMIFVHDRPKSATPALQLLNRVFQFYDLFFEFDVFSACSARLSIQNLASFRSENIPVAWTARDCHTLILLRMKPEPIW